MAVLYREVTITGGRADLAAALALVKAQVPPYLPAQAAIVHGRGPAALSIEFAAPSPLGLLTAVLDGPPLRGLGRLRSLRDWADAEKGSVNLSPGSSCVLSEGQGVPVRIGEPGHLGPAGVVQMPWSSWLMPS